MPFKLKNCTYNSLAVFALINTPVTPEGEQSTPMVLACAAYEGYGLPQCRYGKTNTTFADPYTAIMFTSCRLTGLTSFDIEKTTIAYDQTSGDLLTVLKSQLTQPVPQEMMMRHQLGWVPVTDERFDPHAKAALKALGLIN